MPNGLFSTGRSVIEAKTAAYTMTRQDECKIFTNRGASGSVTFTLPVVTDLPVGWEVTVFTCVAAQNVVIASNGSSDNLTTFNDLQADTLTFSTSSEIAGAGVRLVWDGTGWLTFLHTEETQTVTIA